MAHERQIGAVLWASSVLIIKPDKDLLSMIVNFFRNKRQNKRTIPFKLNMAAL